MVEHACSNGEKGWMHLHYKELKSLNMLYTHVKTMVSAKPNVFHSKILQELS